MLSRKEFFKKGAALVGRAVLEVSESVRPVAAQVGAAAVEPALALEPGEEMVAAACNEHCLARGCGCFSCLERCEHEAIRLLPGQGIEVISSLCTGCGACEKACPVTPKAVRLQQRQSPPIPLLTRGE